MIEDHLVFRGPPPPGFKDSRPFNTWDLESPLDETETFLWFIEENRESPGGVLRSGLVLPPGFAVSKTRKLRFDSEILVRHDVTPDSAFCVEVRGNAMEPVLPSGSVVAISTKVLDGDDGRMYALAHRGQLRVRLLHSLPDYGTRLRSYNRVDHPDEDYPLAESLDEKLKVLGRVFWYTVTL